MSLKNISKSIVIFFSVFTVIMMFNCLFCNSHYQEWIQIAIFGVIYSIFMTLTIIKTLRKRELIKNLIETQAVILERVNTDNDPETGPSYIYTFSFITEENEKVITRTKNTSNYDFKVGSNVNILYEKSRPEDAFFNRKLHIYIGNIVVALFLTITIMVLFVLINTGNLVLK